MLLTGMVVLTVLTVMSKFSCGIRVYTTPNIKEGAGPKGRRPVPWVYS